MPLLNFSPQTLGLLGDTLQGVGIGLLNQRPGEGALGGISQGLLYSNQLQQQRKSNFYRDEQEQMAKQQLAIAQQTAAQQQQAFAQQQQQLKTQQDAARGLFGGPMPSNQAGFRPTGAGPQASAPGGMQPGNPAITQGMAPDQIAIAQQLVQADPGAALNLAAQQAFPKPTGPQSSVAKLGADLKAGLISPTDYAAAVRKENYIAPQQPQGAPDVIRLLQAAGIDPQSPQGQAAIAHALGTEQKPQFGDVITGPQAQALGLDPSGSYQRGPDGRWQPVTTPKTGGTFGPVITGQAAAQQGLDPNGSYQQGPDGRWNSIGSPKDDPAALAMLKAMGIDPKSEQGKALLQQNLSGAGNTPFKQENTLRDEYNTLTKTYGEALAGYNKVAAAANNPSAAGDIALIFGYMKTLDPNSTVREGEFATAAQSGSVPERITNIYNKVLSGERLTQTQRQDFANSALNQFNVYKQRKDELEKYYGGLAKRSGIAPENVIVPFQNAAPPPTTPADLGGLDVWQQYGLVPPSGYKPGGTP